MYFLKERFPASRQCSAVTVAVRWHWQVADGTGLLALWQAENFVTDGIPATDENFVTDENSGHRPPPRRFLSILGRFLSNSPTISKVIRFHSNSILGVESHQFRGTSHS